MKEIFIDFSCNKFFIFFYDMYMTVVLSEVILFVWVGKPVKLVNPFSMVVTKLLIISSSQHYKNPYNISFTTRRPLAMKP